MLTAYTEAVCNIHTTSPNKMSFSPIGDSIAVVKLAYELYNRFVIVARDAPDSLKALFGDLQRIKGVLFLVHNNPTYSAAVRDVLSDCFKTLRELRDLTDKYEKLGQSSQTYRCYG